MTNAMLEESANLDRLKKFMDDMNATNSTLDKMAKLKTYVDDEYIRRILLYTYDPYRRYYVTVSNLEKNKHLMSDEIADDIFSMLDAFDSRAATGHDAISLANAFVTQHFLYSHQIYAVLDRNLKIRLDVSQINSVFTDLIPEFNVALAKSYKKEMGEPDKRGKVKVDFVNDIWYGSRKLDGCRSVCIIDEKGTATFKTRTGIELPGLAILAQEIEKWGLKSVVFDGELCVMDAAGNEDFRGIVTQIHKKDHLIKNAKYNMFDMLTLQEFTDEIGTVKFSDRQVNLNNTVNAAIQKFGNNGNVAVLTQGRIRDVAHLNALREIASKNGWEGLMIRKDVPYEGKRTSNLLKVKDMFDAEYVVTDIETGDISTTFYRDFASGREVYYEDGEYFFKDDFSKVQEGNPIEPFTDTRKMIASLVIMHKNNPVGVGSGLSMAQRQKWILDPSLIIGKTVTIQYFQESEVDGRMSLRFPILKTVYEDGRKA